MTQENPNFIAYQQALENGDFDGLEPGTFVTFVQGMFFDSYPTPETLFARTRSAHPNQEIFMTQVGAQTEVDVPTVEGLEDIGVFLAELLEALKEIELGDDQKQDLLACESVEEALGLAFSFLMEEGVEDPEAYLAERNILLDDAI